jgi:hypothetical protein
LEVVKNHDRCYLGLEKNAEYPKRRRCNYIFVVFDYNRWPTASQYVCKQQPHEWKTCSAPIIYEQLIIPHNGDIVALRNDEVLLPTDATAELHCSVEEICALLGY